MIRFCYNPTSWRDGRPVPGGMADALVQPILEHLPDGAWEIGRQPAPGAVNVYYAHRNKYREGRHREPGRASVFVSHGIADKAWRDAAKVSRRFDWVFVSGPAWTTKLLSQGLQPERIVEAGYTKLDPIFNGQIPAPARDTRIRVVWAPTHGGGGEGNRTAPRPPGTPSSRATTWWHADEIRALLPPSEFDVVEAPHPRHRHDGRSTLHEYVGADVVIADGGSTIYEAWALGLPVVFCDWLTATANMTRFSTETFEAKIYRDRIGYHAREPIELAALAARAAADGITEPEAEFVEGIFPARYRGISGQLHAEALLDIADDLLPRHRPSPKYVHFVNVDNDRVRRAIEGTPACRSLDRNHRWRRAEVVQA